MTVFYIDPGTGAMLFALLTGILGVAGYFLKGLKLKLGFLLSSGKKAEQNDETLPFVIFSEDKRYWSVFEPICRELDRRGFDAVYMAASADDPGLNNPYEHIHAEHIGEGNKAFLRLNFLKATMLLATTPGLDVYQWKRSKDVKYYIHIPHMPGEQTTYRMFGLNYYDALLLSGQYQIDDCRALEKLRGLPAKECVIVGIPYLDEKVKLLENAEAVPHERTVLVAPSWGSNSILNRFGSKLLDELIATGYHIIVRPHPQSFTSEKELMEKLMKAYPDLEWNRDTDNFQVLHRSDIMISDFSGVMFEFSLVFDKPVICAYTDFDKSQFDAWWLDTSIWTATAVPRTGPVLSEENLANIKDMIDACLTDASYRQNRETIREETWQHPGEGAARAADYLIQKYEQLSASPAAAEGPTETARASEEQPRMAEPAEPIEEKNPVAIKTKRKKRIAILMGIAMALIVLMVAVGASSLGSEEEKVSEKIDLSNMQMALALGLERLQREAPTEAARFWYSPEVFALIPAGADKPLAYGLGSPKIGGASDEFFEMMPLVEKEDLPYDEGQDYRGKIIMVSIDPSAESVSLQWVEGPPAGQ